MLLDSAPALLCRQERERARGGAGRKRMDWNRKSIFSVRLLLVFIFSTAVWLLGRAQSIPAPDIEPKSASVIIVGAGISAIAAAKTLSDNGVKDFLILEATDRIGGRMRTEEFAGITIELGANWVEGVHGSQLNPIWKFAQDFKLRTFLSDFSNTTYNSYDNNGYIRPSVVNASFDILASGVNYASNLGTSLTTHHEEDVSILTAQRLFGSVPSTPLEMTLDWQNYDFEFAEPPRITSLKNTQPNPTFVNFGNDEYFVADPRGYTYIVQRLAEEFLTQQKGKIQDSRLQFHKVVRKIQYSQHGVRLVTEDGSIYTSKFAIVTVSLGVLQSNLIEFQPVLPFWKVEPLYKFDMAIYTKIFLKFRYKFWPTGEGTEFFLYASERRGYYPYWQHLENEYPGSNIIFVTVTDDESRRIEQQSDDETKAEIMVVLRHMFGSAIPEAEAILVPIWWKNRFFGGTYSNWPIGVDTHDFHKIQAPVGPLYFCGEHTSQLYNGYVHGAYLTGINTAEALLKCKKSGNCTYKASVLTSNEQRHEQKSSECAAFVKQEREQARVAWSNKLSTMQEELDHECKP
ncbi:hypothetical protein O6H91_02G091200 [Diphasiastrum complanatum]|uniref:Uncharacterized protein n=1 Tax=Diphasiastrum complanatum TaxID=34168 RepID=A0ACC2EHY6_DIPCM|nr:hypothetical protein O6H91_02G091200 [Diphasiastrum complanatum]